MNFSQDLESAILSYLSRRTNLEELRAWLDEHVQSADVSDAAAADLFNHAWLVVCEWFQGDRDETSVRDELAKLVGSRLPA